MANGRMRVSGLSCTGLLSEKSRVSGLAQKSVRTIDFKEVFKIGIFRVTCPKIPHRDAQALRGLDANGKTRVNMNRSVERLLKVKTMGCFHRSNVLLLPKNKLLNATILNNHGRRGS
jgi:hypothetical protein